MSDSTHNAFEPGIRPPNPEPTLAQWYLFLGDRLLLDCREADGPPRVPLAGSMPELDIDASGECVHYMGRRLDLKSAYHCFAGEVIEATTLPAGFKSFDLRSVFGLLDPLSSSLAGRARQLVQWHRDHRYCSRCATPMEAMAHERAKKCPSCGLTSYPRISPATITAITRGAGTAARILLARSPRFPADMYSVIAGFVEPGETLEECVRREVLEEVGLEVENIRYFGSQPWPFPNSLMLGFTAEYAGGAIRLEEEEIADARWFSAAALPRVPPRISIARRLIDWFVEQAGGDLDSVQDWLPRPG